MTPSQRRQQLAEQVNVAWLKCKRHLMDKGVPESFCDSMKDIYQSGWFDGVEAGMAASLVQVQVKELLK